MLTFLKEYRDEGLKQALIGTKYIAEKEEVDPEFERIRGPRNKNENEDEAPTDPEI